MTETEKEFNTFVCESGGTLVSDLVGKSPTFSNADYIFHKYNIVAELKCLDEDKFTDPQFIEKASELYRRAFQQGATRLVVFGTPRVSSDDFSPEYQERLIRLYEEPIRNAVKKANKQIRETKQYFGKNDYDGVLLVVNENNVELSPVHLVQMLSRILSRKIYSSINHAISLSANLPATHPSHGGQFMIWAPMSSPSGQSVGFRRFEAALRESWIKYQEKKQGIHIPLWVDDGLFGSLINKRAK